MPKDLTIEEICERALPLVSCPVTNQNIKARRVWLKQHIENKIAQAKGINSVGPTEFKIDANLVTPAFKRWMSDESQ